MILAIESILLSRAVAAVGGLAKLEEAIRTVVLFAEDSGIDLDTKIGKAMDTRKRAILIELQISLRPRIRASMGI
ncbi:hypothetical protein [Candidatus Raskinella chloraquaticus]|uniref:Uncharacterized protein n=1 Tax=Candidatus Raskinella chloraquaticus TaxID=1951219 RepID=A0A1W9HPQ2_9HYPH|nr:MAG: hypothetical protein A4S15_01505 [Proteobacteria bacterium SG_bin8]